MHALATITSATLLTTLIASGGTLRAADVQPGETQSPMDAKFPDNATTEHTGSVEFFYSNGQFPPQTATGTLTYSVGRRADNTLSFRYGVSVTGTAGLGFYDYTVDGFAGFDTDISFRELWFGPSNIPDTAIRSADGDEIEVRFYADLVLPGSGPGRTVTIETDATNWALAGTVQASVGAGTFFAGGLPVPIRDTTPPIVNISAPDAFSCTCNPATITGTADDPEGFDFYDLEWSTSPSGPWTLIDGGSTPVINGTLGTWDTTGVPHGHAFVRLSAFNHAGAKDVFTTTVFVDQAFADLELRRPIAGEIMGGSICSDGTAWDNCFTRYTIEYTALDGSGTGGPFDPAQPFYTTAVINDPLATWNTLSGPTAVADGAYMVTLTGYDICGHAASDRVPITVDNTRPRAEIDTPTMCERVEGVVEIRGTASDLHLDQWVLEYAGGSADQWTTIATGNTDASGVLANWDTTNLRPCAYVIRLRAVDQSALNCGPWRNETRVLRLVNVGCASDFNLDGIGNVLDLLDFVAQWFQGCSQD